MSSLFVRYRIKQGKAVRRNHLQSHVTYRRAGDATIAVAAQAPEISIRFTINTEDNGVDTFVCCLPTTDDRRKVG